ncbi:hypothetical protein ACMA5I_10325 [Paracoccaceae bacterium GXU_MW_L88]
MKTQAQYITELREDYTGDTVGSLSDARAVRALNRAIDSYSYLAATSSGQWQGVSTPTTNRTEYTLATGETSLTFDESVMSIERIDIEERPLKREEKIYTDGTGKPTAYELHGFTAHFDTEADAEYTVTVFHRNAFPHLVEEDENSTVGIPYFHDEYILAYAAHSLSLYTNDEHRIALERKIEVKKREITDLYARRTESELSAKANAPA